MIATATEWRPAVRLGNRGSHRGSNYTNQEIEFIKANYPQWGPKFVAERLQRSVGSVEKKAFKLGVKANESGIRERKSNSHAGIPLSVDRRKAMSVAMKARWARGDFKQAKKLQTRLGVVLSEAHRKRISEFNLGRSSPLRGRKRPDWHVEKMRIGMRRNTAIRKQKQLEAVMEYLSQNAGRMIMESANELAKRIETGNEDVLQSTDGNWLLGELQRSVESTVKQIVRMAAIVRRLDELGMQIEIASSVVPYLRKIAYGNLSPDLFVALQGNMTLLGKAASMPTPIQEKIARNEPFKVMELNGDHRLAKPLEMTTALVNQVFAPGRVRNEAEQVSFIRERLQAKQEPKSTTDEEKVRIDRKRKGIVVGKTFISLIELEHFYKALTSKKKSKATA